MKTLECAEVNAIPTGAALNRINQGLAEGKTLDELVHGQSQNGKKKRRKKKLKKKPKRDEPKADPAAKRAALTENDEKKPGGPKKAQNLDPFALNRPARPKKVKTLIRSL